MVLAMIVLRKKRRRRTMTKAQLILGIKRMKGYTKLHGKPLHKCKPRQLLRVHNRLLEEKRREMSKPKPIQQAKRERQLMWHF
jgi:hypothetical protein